MIVGRPGEPDALLCGLFLKALGHIALLMSSLWPVGYNKNPVKDSTSDNVNAAGGAEARSVFRKFQDTLPAGKKLRLAKQMKEVISR